MAGQEEDSVTSTAAAPPSVARSRASSSRARGKSRHAFRTISEVAEQLDLPQHVLRFWETRFPQIRPLKRSGNRRYYRPEDVALLEAIRILLHEEGLTIRGVQKRFREHGVRQTVDAVLAGRGSDEVTAPPSTAPAAPAAPSSSASSTAGGSGGASSGRGTDTASDAVAAASAAPGRVFEPGGLARELSRDESERLACERLLRTTLEGLRRLRALFDE